MNQNNLQKIAVYVFLTIGVCALPVIFQMSENTFWLRALCMTMLYIMLAQGLNVVVGMAGLLDLGYIGFYALGAYFYALTNSPYLAEHFQFIASLQKSGWLPLSLLIVLPCAALLAAGAGALFGYPTLKLRGDYLAIVTLGFGEIVRILMVNLGSPLNLTGGTQGISTIRPITTFGLSWTPEAGSNAYLSLFGIKMYPLVLYFYFFLIVTALVVFACHRLQNSRLGRSWMALREDEIAAKAMGIDVRNVKLLAFSIGASFAGIAGAFFAPLQGSIAPEAFKLDESIMVVAMVVLGGIGHIRGVVLGAILLYLIPTYLLQSSGALESFQQDLFKRVIISAPVLKQLLFASSLILIMLYRPKGVWPAPVHGNNKSMNKSTKGASA